MTEHSWKWLTPRMTARKVTDELSAANSRPPLPEMEALDDRVMLSAASVGSNTDINSILIGLIKASTPIVQDELSVVNLLAQDKHAGKWMPILLQDFSKVDTLLYKAGTDLIKGNLTTDAAAAIQAKIELTFSKIETLANKIAPASQDLLPAVQKVREAALGLLGTLNQSPDLAVGKLLPFYAKLSKDFENIDLSFLKAGEELLIKHNPVLNKVFAMKLQDAFNKADTLIKIKFGGDETLLAAVSDVQTQVNDFLAGLSGGGGFTGGPTVATHGDVIS